MLKFILYSLLHCFKLLLLTSCKIFTILTFTHGDIRSIDEILIIQDFKLHSGTQIICLCDYDQRHSIICISSLNPSFTRSLTSFFHEWGRSILLITRFVCTGILIKVHQFPFRFLWQWIVILWFFQFHQMYFLLLLPLPETPVSLASKIPHSWYILDKFLCLKKIVSVPWNANINDNIRAISNFRESSPFTLLHIPSLVLYWCSQ